MILSNDDLNMLIIRRNKALSMVLYVSEKGYKDSIVKWTNEINQLEKRINAHLNKLSHFAMLKSGVVQDTLLKRIETIKQANNL